MAAATRQRIILSLTLMILNAWVWGLGGFLLAFRWNSVERPLPPPHEAFPYGAIRIGVDASYPPFAVDNGVDMYGIDIELGEAIAREIGFPVQFVNMGYDGLYDSLTADQVDVVISALLVDPSKTRDVQYTQGYYNAGLVLVSPVGDEVPDMYHLPNNSIAYEFGSAADAEVRLWQRRVDPFETRPYELPQYALDAVRLGEADAALVDATSYHLYKREYPEWETINTQITHSIYAIAVRIDRDETYESISRALAAVMESGRLDEIFRDWL